MYRDPLQESRCVSWTGVAIPLASIPDKLRSIAVAFERPSEDHLTALRTHGAKLDERRAGDETISS
jgi:hypothetical protein